METPSTCPKALQRAQIILCICASESAVRLNSSIVVPRQVRPFPTRVSARTRSKAGFDRGHGAEAGVAPTIVLAVAVSCSGIFRREPRARDVEAQVSGERSIMLCRIALGFGSAFSLPGRVPGLLSRKFDAARARATARPRKENAYAYWCRPIFQRQERLRLHPARRRLQGPVRAQRRGETRRAQTAAGEPEDFLRRTQRAGRKTIGRRFEDRVMVEVPGSGVEAGAAPAMMPRLATPALPAASNTSS